MGYLSSYSPVTSLAGTERFPLVTTPGGGASGNKYITADNLAIAVGGGAVAGVLNLMDYGAVGNGTTDDSVAIRNWCLAAAAIASPTNPIGMYAPPGTYKTTLAGITTDPMWTAGTIGMVPSNVRMYGVPQKTWFYQTGVPAVEYGVNNEDSYQVFGVANGSSNIIFEDLAFRGENDPFVYYWNNVAAAIAILLTTSHDILVRRCRFRNLYGFSVWDGGENEDIHVVDCWMFECSNGLNVCANGTIQTGNYMDTCEGIECSGARALIANNIIINAQGVAIGMGGAGADRSGVIVANNVIDGGTETGIRIGDGNFGAIIDGNVVRKTTFQGISFGEAFPGYAPINCVVSNNVFVDCGRLAVGASIGMDINVDNITVVGNMSYDSGTDALYEQAYGCFVSGDNCYIAGNYLGGTTRDLEIELDSVNTRVGENFYSNNNVRWNPGGASTVAADARWFKAATDKLREHWITGEYGGGRFAEYAGGKFEWGDGTAARDTNLYRSAANVLKTDDTLAAALGLLLTEQTAPSAPATNNVILYAVDNGSGKTKLMALFPTGAAVQVAIEP